MRLVFVLGILLASGARHVWGDATIEGRVELPKTKSAPVMAKRYEIGTSGGFPGTNPTLAVVDRGGPFSKPASLPAGHYNLKAWIDSRTTREHSVDLPGGSTLHVDFP